MLIQKASVISGRNKAKLFAFQGVSGYPENANHKNVDINEIRKVIKSIKQMALKKY